MSAADKLNALAATVEALDGPSREVDWAVVTAIGKADFYHRYAKEPLNYKGLVPLYTASLDAAMTLVPEGFEWVLYSDASCEMGVKPEPGRIMEPSWTTEAATPALALVAACLRAKAQETEHG